MKHIEQWEGKLEKRTELEYSIEQTSTPLVVSSELKLSHALQSQNFFKPDKADYIVAASCGLLTGLLDAFWVGDFSLVNAQEWGRTNANGFVLKVARSRGYKKESLDGAVRFLEKEAPIPSDQLMALWGGTLQHHFRDFAHHASIVGLVFSVLSQFTGMSYGTNTDGGFEVRDMPNKNLIGQSFEDKIYNGTVIWALHLVSDMVGSGNTAGKGTGIPGPILSLAKELSVLPKLREMKIKHNGEEIDLSVMLSKLFNGTAFAHTSSDDLVRFDLRTEMGAYAFAVKQSIPVVINQCMVRGFYFVKRLLMEINNKQLNGITDIERLEPKHFVPWNNQCIVRMLTIASGIFCVVDLSDAAIRAYLKSPRNKTEFLPQLLLHSNFAGIGNFIICIKNDIKISKLGDQQTLTDASSLTESNISELVEDEVSIDISVDIDNTGLYKHSFYRMHNHIKETKERFAAAQKGSFGLETSLLRLEDEETDLFAHVASGCQHSLKIETEDLMMRLFTLYGVEYIPFDGEVKYSAYMPFYRMEDEEKVGYVFLGSLFAPVNKWKELKEEYHLDRIKAVAMVELGEDSKTRRTILSEQERKSEGFVQYIPIKELFSLIEDSEYDMYMTYVRKFNADIKKLIGYRTIVVPSESSLQELKVAIESELRTIKFDELLSQDALYDNQIEIIKKNFWDRSFYMAIIGEAPFAESFISSEWYYRNHAEFSALEHTAIIAGYLKSVEQLLYSIVQLSEGTGKQIKKYGGDKTEYIDYCLENEPLIDTTLGSLIGYVRHYSDLWDVSTYAKNYVTEKLNTYRQMYRNDHFHKDNVYSVAEIDEIRWNTMLIHYLLLGSMRISDDDKEKLGIFPKQANEKKDITYEDLEIWLDRILGGDVLLSELSAIYFEIKIRKGQWGLELSTVSGFDERGLPQDMRWPYIGDILRWDMILDKDSTEKKMLSLIGEYLEKGTYSGNLKRYSMVSVGYFGKPHILYRK